MDYKDTINLLDTSFSMRGDLAKREPKMLEKWIKQDRYNKLRQKCASRDKFIVHDGPPYANGQLHIGHASNKILKDIIIRSKTLLGLDAPFVPGWDCHGLPIELNIEKQFGKNLAPAEFRKKCREYANSQIEAQKTDFIRLGILGQWDKPYKTMDYTTEAGIVRALGEIYQNGYLAKGFKPVHWCIDCKSALAEAEVEYQDKQSPAIDVAFRAIDKVSIANTFAVNIDELEVFAVIWTTTPWTLPANQAICVGDLIEYALVDCGDKYIIVASKLVESIVKRYNITSQYKIIATVEGKNLEYLEFEHPFYNRQIPIILGEHATDDAGTGLVHTAPAHGVDDFNICMKYKQFDLQSPVDERGCYLDSVPLFTGLHVFKANDEIIKVLEQNNRLMAKADIVHSYPCCWRHKSKIIYRTTTQWFIKMDELGNSHAKNNLSIREMALEQIEINMQFYPKWGKSRLESMIKDRPDWCVSRQRNWSVPMTFFIHNDTGVLHPDSYNLLNKIVKKIEKEGIDAWFSLKPQDILLPEDVANYSKLADTLDVWFDSGTTHETILKDQSRGLNFPADLYLEGSDQHRGWFQSSLLTSCAISGVAPYRALLTHGFLVDGDGYKMSKSKGNIVAISDAVNKYGADILRLWVASTDYSGDISFSDEIMKRTTDSYRRIRNTLRFLLANLSDFDIKRDVIAVNEMVAIDQYALAELEKIRQNIVNNLYSDYQFHVVVQKLVTYCSEELGGFYLDILKDRLYTAKANGHARRSCQTALYYITQTLLMMLSPILSFTADEAWEVLVNDDTDSTLYHTWDDIAKLSKSTPPESTSSWQMIRDFRIDVLKELENKRINGEIGSSLQANLVIYADNFLYPILSSLGEDLKFVYMVSEVILKPAQQSSIEVCVSDKPKCERCWHYSASVGTNLEHPTICERCVCNIDKHGSGEIRKFA